MATIFLGIAAAVIAAALIAGIYLTLVTQRIARDAERKVPPLGGFVTIDGERIHYVEKGEGRPVVMIHGLGGTLHHLRRPLMEEFGEGYRLIAMDRPGSGYSTRIGGHDGRLSEQAHFVAAFIDRLGLENPLLVGHSLGGAIALATALDYPEKVAGIALISPLTRNQRETPAAFGPLAIRSPFLRRLVANTIAVPMSVRNAPAVLDMVFGPQQPPADFAVAGGALVGLRPSHFYATSTDMTAVGIDMPRQETRYGELAMPVGVLFGTADRILDHRVHGVELGGRIAGLDLELLEGIGHMPQYARTAEVVAFIRRIADRAFAREPAGTAR